MVKTRIICFNIQKLCIFPTQPRADQRRLLRLAAHEEYYKADTS
jgi:hypothetical protein